MSKESPLDALAADKANTSLGKKKASEADS